MEQELLYTETDVDGEGVEDSELAEQDEEITDENPVADEESEDEDDSESTTDDSQDFKNEQNATYANMRRKAEADARARYDSEIAKLCEGYVHPITKQPIRTLAEYKDALYQQERIATESKLRENGLDPKMIDNAIANNPMIREAQMVIENSRRAEATRTLESEFAQIQKFDPSITSFDKIPNIDVITNMVENGYRLVDAYKLVNFDSIMQASKAGAKQGAINQFKGKSHLTGMDSLATDNSADEIPTDVFKAYREIYPDKSSAELKKLYNKTMKKLGGK